MARLEQEIATLKNRLGEIEWDLQLYNICNDEVIKNQEQMEHRLHNIEESHKDMGEKISLIQKDVGQICEYLNNAIARINDLHQCLNLLCDEKMDGSNDDDDDDAEFNLDGCSKKSN